MSDRKPQPLKLIHRRSGDPARVQKLGPYHIESLIDAEEEGAGTAWRVSIGPNQRTSVSYHKLAEEYYYVLAGSGVAVLGGVPHPIAAGDFLRLPPGTTHGFETADQTLEMLNMHTPGSRPDRDVYFVDGDVPEGFGRCP